MTRRLDVTERQVTALCNGAKKAGHVAVIQIGNTLVRFVPEEHVVNTGDEKPVSKAEDFRL